MNVGCHTQLPFTARVLCMQRPMAMRYGGESIRQARQTELAK